jgi:hypothetical protein
MGTRPLPPQPPEGVGGGDKQGGGGVEKNFVRPTARRDFKRGFEIYTSSKQKTSKIIQEVETIRCNMNSQRSNFSLPVSYKVRITPY